MRIAVAGGTGVGRRTVERVRAAGHTRMAGMRAGDALPGPDADLGSETFDQWLAAR
ncbi:hypothetical protein [Microbacterium sp. SA39]|uniref:hypothetical protein n=1 Tax=Microbacterium sp. SA39 TaxID=1263625 RepID=UPI000ABD552C|nr:hypothetical protein [Microbacterium sp. SA39]